MLQFLLRQLVVTFQGDNAEYENKKAEQGFSTVTTDRIRWVNSISRGVIYCNNLHESNKKVKGGAGDSCKI